MKGNIATKTEVIRPALEECADCCEVSYEEGDSNADICTDLYNIAYP